MPLSTPSTELGTSVSVETFLGQLTLPSLPRFLRRGSTLPFPQELHANPSGKT